ncbi:condensin-2 complex subunit D3 isoform X1 [Neodiprion pinetum]|uniref:condensin-2 complex subunit D3 isoform X1 n=2 Tax=Neodiprion pinetum TaxID=441929 RepID=UPI001EDDB427|nr:condensin-2 complex subunit D3-like isoform X1 [Neodiprion pinetum]
MEPLQIFEDFRLDNLDESWVKSVWESEFLTFDDIPAAYLDYLNSEDMDVLLKDSSTVIKNWMCECAASDGADIQRTEVSWQTLIALNVNPRSLLPVLGYLMKNGNSFDADEEARQPCLKATSLYFVLLSVPGSNAFQVFHLNLYHLALKTFMLSDRLVQKSRQQGKRVNPRDAYNSDDDEGDMELFDSEKLTLCKGLNSVMFDITTMLRGFHLCDQPRSLEITVHSLIKVTGLSKEVINFETRAVRQEASVNSLSYNAYIALSLLCDAHHGAVDVTIRLIAKYLLPSLVSNQDGLLPKELSAVRESMTNFVKKLLIAHQKDAHLGVTTLIQHLMVKCPERVEARTKQAALIFKLVNSCKDEVYLKAVEDLIVLAHNNKVLLRIFAEEIMGRFLTDNTSTTSQPNQKVRKALLATVLSRCLDSSSLVRGKAMSIFADCTDPQNSVTLNMVKEIFDESNSDKPLPSLNTLQQSIFEDRDPLPGCSTVACVLAARVEDERAFVRRSALQSLGNLVDFYPGILNTLTPALGLHCRDPAILVRRYAVQVFTQLVEKFPEHPLLTQDWVRNVLPQIFDVEMKVQEKVLESLQQLIIANVTRLDDDDLLPKADLPWLILNQITEQKMRKHLTKACAVWAKTSVLTNSLITKIMSHLDSRNDIPALVLLTAIANYRELSNMSKYFQNYKEILCRDTYQASLVIELLRNSWPNLDDAFLKKMQVDLFERLCCFQVNFNLVGICCDLYTDVTKYLNPENGDQIVKQNSLHLMKLSETLLEKFIDHEDNEEDALQTYLKAMSTLSNASHLCVGSISPSTLRVLEGIVVEWDSLPDAVRYLHELRAAAVTVLGQQAMRDREIAQEIMPILGHIMRMSTAQSSDVQAAVKVNAAKALADICVRFTALVEPYLPDMCVSMKDQNPIIREAIVVLFIQLLLEDFIKVKGPFFFHILTMLTDTDEMVRDLTVFLINERLLVKNKTLIFRQFLESIFHYNNLKLPKKFSSNVIGQRALKALTLPGRRNKNHRRVIYNFMLEHLEPVEKVKIVARLTSEILSAIISGAINVQKEEGLSVLKDCLYILSREELHPTSCSKRTEDDSQDESLPIENLPINNTVNAVANEMKKQRVEVLVPTLVKLKKMFIKLSSPFASDVARYYLKIVAEYKKEQLLNLFSEYPAIEKEIEEDRKKYGSNTFVDDADADAETAEQQTNLALIRQERMPKIVLRRLSTLTYPGMKNWRSPSQASQSDEQSSQFEYSRSQTPLPSPIAYAEISSPPLCQPGPSLNSTPTMSKSRNSRHSLQCSPIHAGNNYVYKNLKYKGVPIISEEDDEEEPLPVQRRKIVPRKLRCQSPQCEEAPMEIGTRKERSKFVRHSD